MQINMWNEMLEKNKEDMAIFLNQEDITYLDIIWLHITQN